MKRTLTIAQRELSSLFYSPIAYVVLSLFALGATLIFLMRFGPNQPATLRPMFEGIIWLMILLVPGISMRLFSEEYRNGTIEPLMTSPISDTQIVIGKWLGAMAFFAILIAPLLVHLFVLEWNGSPDYGPVMTGLIGLMLVGGFYLAIGTFASTVTQNQIIAFFVTVFIICLFTFLLFFLPQATFVNETFREAMNYMNVNFQYADFAKGLIDLTNFIYFFSGIALFLFLAVLTLQSKRWR